MYRPQGGVVSNQFLHPTDRSSENRSLYDKKQEIKCLNILHLNILRYKKFSLISLIIVSGNILNITFYCNIFLVNSRGQCDSKRHVSVLLNSLFTTFTHLMQCLNSSTVFTSQTERLVMQTTPVSLKLVLPLERVTHPAPTHLKICRSAIQPWTLNNCLMVSICGADNNASLPVTLTHQALLATSTPPKGNLSQAEFQHWKRSSDLFRPIRSYSFFQNLHKWD